MGEILSKFSWLNFGPNLDIILLGPLGELEG